MREIKFRAWYLHKMYAVYAVNPMNQTVYLSHQQLMGRPGDDVLVPWNNGIEEDGCELMQFTGLLDKNGQEIYEGDIVRCDKQEWYRTDRSMGRDVVGKPEYQEEVIWEFEMLTMRQNDYPQYWTVIGNIYEKPELLLNKAKPEEGK